MTMSLLPERILRPTDWTLLLKSETKVQLKILKSPPPARRPRGPPPPGARLSQATPSFTAS
jgi:hypothetical protein